MKIDAKKVSLCHLARKRLNLTDEHYRRLLSNICGVESTKDIHDDDFPYLMQAFEAMGFQSDFAKAHGGNLRHWSKASAPQLAKIDALWRELHGGELDPGARDRWCARMGADSVRFFDRDQAKKAIAGLLSWQARVAARAAKAAGAAGAS